MQNVHGYYSHAISSENLIYEAKKRKLSMEMNSPNPPDQDGRKENEFLKLQNTKMNSNRGMNSP